MMIGSTRRLLLGGLASAALVPASGRAQPAAEPASFPARPVRILVPFPPGQAADVFARFLGEELSKRWPQRVFVENRAGGAGAIGMEAGAGAPPDGYTLVMGTSGTLGINPSVVPRLPYDAERDFAAVACMYTTPLVLVAHPGTGPRDLAAAIEAARQRPASLTYASAGPGTAQHMAMEMLAHRAGIQMVHVPYRGSGPAMADVLAGNVPLMMDSSVSALPHVQSGRVRALAVSGRERLPQIPSVPTVAELGMPDYEALGWAGIVAPAATPPALLRRINADVVAILRDPAVAARMAEMGGTPTPGTSEEFSAFIRAEIAKWRKVAQDARITLEG